MLLIRTLTIAQTHLSYNESSDQTHGACSYGTWPNPLIPLTIDIICNVRS